MKVEYSIFQLYSLAVNKNMLRKICKTNPLKNNYKFNKICFKELEKKYIYYINCYYIYKFIKLTTLKKKYVLILFILITIEILKFKRS